MTIQGTDARNGVMKQTKSELDDGQLDKYSLKESSDQDQFKTIQKLINNKTYRLYCYGTKLVL